MNKLFKNHPFVLSFLIIVKEMSKFSDLFITMNLHEECLLKYLINPIDLLNVTESLRINNELISKEFEKTKHLVRNSKIKYTEV